MPTNLKCILGNEAKREGSYPYKAMSPLLEHFGIQAWALTYQIGVTCFRQPIRGREMAPKMYERASIASHSQTVIGET